MSNEHEEEVQSFQDMFDFHCVEMVEAEREVQRRVFKNLIRLAITAAVLLIIMIAVFTWAVVS